MTSLRKPILIALATLGLVAGTSYAHAEAPVPTAALVSTVGDSPQIAALTPTDGDVRRLDVAVASVAVAAQAPASVTAPAGSAAPMHQIAEIKAEPPRPSDTLHDPLTDPAGTYADLVGAKQRGGWALLVLGVLVVLTRLLARVGGTIGAWFGHGTRGVVVAAGAAMAVGAYDAIALGGSWAGVIVAALGAALALWHPVPKPAKPQPAGASAGVA